jgi:DNA-binding LytR/AlgR family response regulator
MKLETVVDETASEVELTIRTPSLMNQEYQSLLQMLERPKTLLGKKRGSVHAIEIGDVYWFESVDDKVFLYTEKETFETAYRLYELETRLADQGFVRIGKSQIVAMAKIRSFRFAFSGKIEATLKNGEKVLVSRTYVKGVRAKLEEWGGVRHETN